MLGLHFTGCLSRRTLRFWMVVAHSVPRQLSERRFSVVSRLSVMFAMLVSLTVLVGCATGGSSVHGDGGNAKVEVTTETKANVGGEVTDKSSEGETTGPNSGSEDASAPE